MEKSITEILFPSCNLLSEDYFKEGNALKADELNQMLSCIHYLKKKCEELEERIRRLEPKEAPPEGI